MTYGSGFEWMISDEQEAIKQMKYAYDKGINVSHVQVVATATDDSFPYLTLRLLIRPTSTVKEKARYYWVKCSSSTTFLEKAWSS